MKVLEVSYAIPPAVQMHDFPASVDILKMTPQIKSWRIKLRRVYTHPILEIQTHGL